MLQLLTLLIEQAQRHFQSEFNGFGMIKFRSYERCVYNCVLNMDDNRGEVFVDGKPLHGDRCIRKMLGEHIDIEWNKTTGRVDIESSKGSSFSYEKMEDVEKFRFVPLRHGVNCPLLREDVKKNADRKMRPCACVLIQDETTGKILATQRPANISFGGLWVLPGGHLQKGEGVIEGGLRECAQQVGMPIESSKVDLSSMMVWQSVFTRQGVVKATALVVFFRTKSLPFEVIGQVGEVDKWQWRQGEKGKCPWGGNWAEGHYTYLSQLFPSGEPVPFGSANFSSL